MREAKNAGVTFVSGSVESVAPCTSHVQVTVFEGDITSPTARFLLTADHFVNAAGPWAGDVHDRITRSPDASAAAFPLPLENELHAKVIFHDSEGVIPRDAPMMISSDPVHLEWDEEMRSYLEETASAYLKDGDVARAESTSQLLRPLPAGVHYRPSSTPGYVLMLWEFVHQNVPVETPALEDPSSYYTDLYVEMVVRGLAATVAPGLETYVESGRFGAKTSVDGGYYTKTPDNMPLVGIVPETWRRCSVVGGLAGFGVMAACGTAELLAAQITSSLDGRSDSGSALKRLERAFRIDRFEAEMGNDDDEGKAEEGDIPDAFRVIGGSI